MRRSLQVGRCLVVAGTSYLPTRASACPHTSIYVSTSEKERGRTLHVWTRQTDEGLKTYLSIPKFIAAWLERTRVHGVLADPSASRGFNPTRQERVEVSLMGWSEERSYCTLIYVVGCFNKLPIGIHIFIRRRVAVRQLNFQGL